MVMKKALLVGCNYPGQVNFLQGCCNDARRMCTLLKNRFGFTGENIDVLVDDNHLGTAKSTKANIERYLDKLVEGATGGDILVFFFSGHGGLKEKSNDNTGWNEAIYPNDIHNPLTDDDFRARVNNLQPGVNFTFISDSCSSGGLIDAMKEQIGDAEGGVNNHRQLQTYQETHGLRSKRMTLTMLITALNNTRSLNYTVDESNYQEAIYALHKENASLTITSQYGGRQKPAAVDKPDDVGILLSGCESWEYSRDVPGDTPDASYGTFTKEIENAVSTSRSISNKEMIHKVRSLIQLDWDQTTHEPEKEPQHPCLYCSDGNVNKSFICDFVTSR